MSTPSWLRPPERDAPQVLLNARGPATGQAIPLPAFEGAGDDGAGVDAGVEAGEDDEAEDAGDPEDPDEADAAEEPDDADDPDEPLAAALALDRAAAAAAAAASCC